MEESVKSFQLPNLTTLPVKVILDLQNELCGLSRLRGELRQIFSKRDYETVVKKMISSISFENDILYSISEFAVDVSRETFCYVGIDSELRDLQNLLYNTAFSVHNHISQISGYVDGVFPYECTGVVDDFEITLTNRNYLNHVIQLGQHPFVFNS